MAKKLLIEAKNPSCFCYKVRPWLGMESEIEALAMHSGKADDRKDTLTGKLSNEKIFLAQLKYFLLCQK